MKKLIIGAAFAALVGVGCSSQAVNPRGQTTEICAVGLPVVAWISHVSQDADHVGSDTNIVTQANQQSFSGEVTKPEK